MSEWGTLREILDRRFTVEQAWEEERRRCAEQLEAEVAQLEAKGIPLDAIHEEIGRHQLQVAKKSTR